MAKESSKKNLYSRILEEEAERLSAKEVEKMQDSCGTVPEHFREMVQSAVAGQLETYSEMLGPETNKTAQRGKIKKRRFRTWLLAAAVFAVCGIAAASGSSWLMEHLLERGFTESEAEVLLETELPQEASENMNVAFPHGAEIQEADWTEGVLTVKEAYFDGESLYFIAEVSKEAQGCEVQLKDHASVGGHDGMTTLQKLENENSYLGQIMLTKKEAADEILAAQTVEVSMTVMTSVKPEEYEGRILYTWKDSEAYEKLFGTGAFQSQYGPCYVMSRKEAAGISYTPQKLTLELPLTESAKQVIEQYRMTGGPKAGDPASEPEGMETDGAPAEAEGTAEGAVNAESMIEETVDAGKQEPQKSNLENVVQSEGDHVLCEIPAVSGALKIDAEVVQRTQSVYTGTLQAEAVSDEVLQSLYETGKSDGWKESGSEEEWAGWKEWQYQDQNIFVGGNAEHIHYQNDEVKAPEEVQAETAADKEALKEQSEQVLKKLGMEGTVTENPLLTGMPQKYYQVQLLLEDLPVAWRSQWNMECMFDWLDGELVGVNAPGVLKVLEKEEAALPDMEEILEHVAEYAAAGEIEAPQSGAEVTEISLEYYIDLTKQGLIFRPIWNFKLPYLNGPEDAGAIWAENYFYIDALTGALVRGVAD